MPSSFDEPALVADIPPPGKDLSHPLHGWPDPGEAVDVWERLSSCFADPGVATWRVRPPRDARDDPAFQAYPLRAVRRLWPQQES